MKKCSSMHFPFFAALWNDFLNFVPTRATAAAHAALPMRAGIPVHKIPAKTPAEAPSSTQLRIFFVPDLLNSRAPPAADQS